MSTKLLVTVGIISILGQVVVLRELSVALYGVELIYVLAMGVWLFWTACGALLGKRTFVPTPVTVGYLLIVFSLLLPLDVALIRALRILFSGVPGAYLSFAEQIAAIVIALCPIGVLLGLGFQWSAKLTIASDGSLAKAYGIESIGGLIGGLAATLLLFFGIGNFAISILCGVIAASMPLLSLDGKAGRHRLAGIVAIALLCLSWMWSDAIDQQMIRWNHPNLVVSKDSPYSRITITGREGQFVVFENDALGFETEGTGSEEFVHLSAIHHENPKRVLILGGGVEGIVEEVLKHRPATVDYVELNAVLLELVKDYMPEAYRKSLKSPGVSIHAADPRTFLKDAATYDLILTAMPEPFSGQSNRFYTREYFQSCAERLDPSGVLAFRLPSAENVWTSMLAYRNTSIFKALTAVFQDVLVLPGVTNTIIASQTRLVRNPKRLSDRFSARHIEAKLVTPAYIDYLYTNDRFFEIDRRLRATDAPPNTDIRPVCYQYSVMIWISKFFSHIINWDLSFSKTINRMGGISYGIVVLLLAALSFSMRRRNKARRVMLTAVAGFMGMMMETMLVLHYQSKNGALFQNIGILLMVFMAGLAAGAILSAEWAGRYRLTHGAFGKSAGRGLLVGFGLLHLAFWFLLKKTVVFGIILTAGFLFGAGFFVAGIFAYAAYADAGDQRNVVSSLYAADLLGGCAGSIIGSLLVIPFFGLEQSAVWMIGVSLVSLLMV
jgi:spermidine synthase